MPRVSPGIAAATAEQASVGSMSTTRLDGVESRPQTATGSKGGIFAPVQRLWRAYEHGLGQFVGFAARKYGELGAYTARQPVLVMSVSIVLSILICLGWFRFRLETSSDVLWVPRSGKAVDDKHYVEAKYPKSKAGASFYAQLKNPPGGDAITLPVTWEMFQLHNKILALTVQDDAGNPVKFQNLCYKAVDGTCDISGGYLWYWSKSFDVFKQEVGLVGASSPAGGNDTAFHAVAGKAQFPDGSPVSLLSVFGGTTFTFQPTFAVKSAQVIASDYSLDNSISDETVKRWNDAFNDLLEAERPSQQFMTYTWITGSTVGEELNKSINNDMFLVIISILVFIVIAVMFLTKPSMVATRTTLALAGVFATALGIMTGWGWGMIFGMPFTPLQQLSPFILLGMGIDVVFILVKSYEIIIQREPWLTMEQAFYKLMSTAGLSVQVTLLASAVAFALGAVDKLASVKWFSAFATLNTLMIMVLAMTLFVACMVITERRIKARRWDCCCCVISNKDAAAAGIPTSEPSAVAKVASMTTPPGKLSDDQQMSRTPSPTVISDDDIKDENMVKKFFRKIYAPLLTKWYVKVFILCIFTAYAVISLYGIYHVKYGQPLSDLASDGSYLQEYDQVQEETFRKQVGSPVGQYFRNLDVSDPQIQYKMLKAWDMALQDDYVNATNTAFLSNWLISFITFTQKNDSTAIQVMPTNNCYNPIINLVSGDLASVPSPTKKPIQGCVKQDRFYEMFYKWIASGSSNDIICNTGTCKAGSTIQTSKFKLMLVAEAGDDKYGADVIESIRNVEDDISSQVFASDDAAADTYVSFIYGSEFVFNEGDRILPEQALTYFVLALVGVGVVCTFMLVNPIASLLMMISVGLVVLYLFGELWILHIRFNQVSIINMIMATGLAVDYSVYFAQKFMTVQADGTGNGRMQAAMTDTGSAVFLGGFTALCGTVPMAFAKSVIIRTFFKLIFGTILFALLIGLALVPVVFSLIPLPPVKSVLVDAAPSDLSLSREGRVDPSVKASSPASAAEHVHPPA